MRDFLIFVVLTGVLLLPSVAADENVKKLGKKEEEIETLTIYKSNSHKKASNQLSKRFVKVSRKAQRAHHKGQHEKEKNLFFEALGSDKLLKEERLYIWKSLIGVSNEVGDPELRLLAHEKAIGYESGVPSDAITSQRLSLAKEYYLRGRYSEALAILVKARHSPDVLSASQSLFVAQLLYAIGKYDGSAKYADSAIEKSSALPAVTASQYWYDLANSSRSESANLGILEPIEIKGLYEEQGYPLPLVRVQPQYPRRASDRNIEGHVTLRFATKEDGTVNTDRIVMVEAVPAGYFERASVSALIKFRYKPVVIDGKALPYEWLTFKFEFRTR